MQQKHVSGVCCAMSSLFPVTQHAALMETRQNKSPHIGTYIIAADKTNLIKNIKQS